MSKLAAAAHNYFTLNEQKQIGITGVFSAAVIIAWLASMMSRLEMRPE
jgi:hypothetical protein